MIKITQLFDLFNDFYERDENKSTKKYVKELEQKIKEQNENITNLKSQIQELGKILELKEKTIGELEQRNVRMQADYRNFERIIKKDKEDFIKYASKDILRDLITIKEDLERAVKQDGSNNGINMIYQKMLQLLKNEGIKEIPTVGEKFDYNKHEVLMAEESEEEEEDTILEEFEKGYIYKDKVLKPARVKIAKNKSC
ncbi:MAG: nucleotide exchange factor GrpE [Candidatus Lokiarchaeota archaeon]|nr:nucleotide exchange factor GrpE [Candidatus Lokiarchaeota archaeon]